MAVEFKTDKQRACYDRVAGFMRELFGEMVRPSETNPLFSMNYGSAYVETGVWDWGEQTCVRTRSWVVYDTELRPDLLDYLLKENDKLLFGGFGLMESGTITYNYAVLGDAVDKEEIRNAVMLVARMADKYDDLIVARWGGRRQNDPK